MPTTKHDSESRKARANLRTERMRRITALAGELVDSMPDNVPPECRAIVQQIAALVPRRGRPPAQRTGA